MTRLIRFGDLVRRPYVGPTWPDAIGVVISIDTYHYQIHLVRDDKVVIRRQFEKHKHQIDYLAGDP